MNAATELLNKEGINAVSIRNIASRIEYSPRTIYLYFKNKDDLLQNIIESGFAVSVRTITDIEASKLKPIEKISLFLRANIEMALQNSNYYMAVISIIHKKDFKMGPNQLRVAAFLKSELSLIQKSRSRKSSTPDQKLLLIASFLRGFNVELIHHIDIFTEKQKNQLVDQFIVSMTKGII